MVTKKKSAKSRVKVGKLKLNKETVKDLKKVKLGRSRVVSESSAVSLIGSHVSNLDQKSNPSGRTPSKSLSEALSKLRSLNMPASLYGSR